MSAAVGCNILQMSNGSNQLIGLFKSSTTRLIFCLVVLLIIESVVFKSVPNCGFAYNSLKSYQFPPARRNFGALYQVYKCIRLFCALDELPVCHYGITLSSLPVFALKSTLLDINMAILYS